MKRGRGGKVVMFLLVVAVAAFSLHHIFLGPRTTCITEAVTIRGYRGCKGTDQPPPSFPSNSFR